MNKNGHAPIQQTIVLLEQEIEALDQRRGELVRVIDSLRPLAGDAVGGRAKKALKNERTNERTSKARARSQAATEPP